MEQLAFMQQFASNEFGTLYRSWLKGPKIFCAKSMRSKTERLKIMKFQELLGSSSGRSSGPPLVMAGRRAYPDQRLRTKEKSYDFLNRGSRGALPSETVRSVMETDSSVVSKAGAVAQKSVLRRVAILDLQTWNVHYLINRSAIFLLASYF